MAKNKVTNNKSYKSNDQWVV